MHILLIFYPNISFGGLKEMSRGTIILSTKNIHVKGVKKIHYEVHQRILNHG